MAKLKRRNESANTPYHGVRLTVGKDTPLVIDNQRTKSIAKGFFFLNRSINQEYDHGLKTVPLRSCLLLNKSAVFQAWTVKTKPKWMVDLLQTDFDTNTGEIIGQSVYRTDDLTSGNNRKIKAVNRFCDHYKPMYERRQVSLFFYTLTLANQAAVSVSDCLDAFKKRLRRRGIKIHGYVWVLEVSDNLHVHYHAIVAMDRINLRGKKLPEYLKLDDVWGARCQLQFVTGNVKSYLAKYFVKNKNRILGKRQFGIVGVPKKKPIT